MWNQWTHISHLYYHIIVIILHCIFQLYATYSTYERLPLFGSTVAQCTPHTQTGWVSLWRLAAPLDVSITIQMMLPKESKCNSKHNWILLLRLQTNTERNLETEHHRLQPQLNWKLEEGMTGSLLILLTSWLHSSKVDNTFLSCGKEACSQEKCRDDIHTGLIIFLVLRQWSIPTNVMERLCCSRKGGH